MNFKPVTPHGNVVTAFEAKAEGCVIRKDNYDSFSIYSVAIGSVRHMPWANRTPIGERGIITASSGWEEGYRISAVAGKSRDAVELNGTTTGHYVKVDNIVRYLLDLVPQVENTVPSGTDPLISLDDWDKLEIGF